MNTLPLFFKNSFLLFISLTIFSACGPDPEKIEKTEKIALEIKTRLMPAMMKRLFSTIEAEGFAGAVDVCAGTAETALPSKSKEFTEKYQDEGVAEILIRRVSLKVRNPNDQPDEFEQKVLEEWAELESGPDETEAETVSGASEGRYYALSPIRIVHENCLKCHGAGESLDPKAAQKIKELYPDDQASGYQLNDLRGGFSVRVTFK